MWAARVVLSTTVVSAGSEAGEERTAPLLDEETFGLPEWVLDGLDDDDALALLEALESIETEDKAEQRARFVPKADQVLRRATAADEYRNGAAVFLAREKSEAVRPLSPYEKGRISAPDKKLEDLLTASITRASMRHPNQVRRSK